MKNFWTKVFVVLCVLVAVSGLIRFIGGGNLQTRGPVGAVRPGMILALNLEGVLIDGKSFLKDLRKYATSSRVKGVLIHLDSPGGTVAASQALYSEFKRIKEELKKPVVISVGNIMASGALLAAAGASRVLVHAGSLVGSVGVIRVSINKGRLYEWAKLEPYSIKTGEFKDIGADYRRITSRERVLIQDLLSELLEQFKATLMEGRKLSEEELAPYTDARIFTGETAVSAGFADSVGSYSDAIELVGEMTGLGKSPHLFTPEPGYLDRISSRFFGGEVLRTLRHFLIRYRMEKTPLYILPSALGF